MHQLQEMMMAQRYNKTLTDLLNELESDPEAIALFEEFHPGFWDDIAEQGYHCLELDQLPQALRIFSFLLHYHPSEAAYCAAFGDALAGLRDYMEAASAYSRVVVIEPEIPDAHFYLAEIWLFFQHHAEAIEKLNIAAALMMPIDSHYLKGKTNRYLEYAHEAVAAQSAQ